MADPDTDILKLVYNACNPWKPATREQYVDCSDVRGMESFGESFQRELSFADDLLGPADFLCVLFTGHSGCGKSSELAKLADRLQRPNPPTGQKRYYPVVVDADEYLDRFDAGMPDLLLSIVAQLGSELQKLKIDPGERVFKHIFENVKEFLGDWSVDEVKAGLNLGWGNVAVGVKRLQKDPVGRAAVRERLLPGTASLLSEIATLFADMRNKLQKVRVAVGTSRYDDFVLIIDNLEKIDRFDGQQPGLASHRTLFIEGSPQLRGLGAHAVFTVPLALVRSPSGPVLLATYGEVFVLPMIKIMERDGSRFERGRQRMVEMVSSRLDGVTVDEAIGPEALDEMITYSGGHVRSLMRYLQSAAIYAQEVPVELEASERAIGQTVRLYSTAIPDRHWPKLVAIERSEDRKIAPDDDDYSTMLENLSVLEYMNGTGTVRYAKSEPWYAVNPVVKELSKYKSAEAAAGGV